MQYLAPNAPLSNTHCWKEKMRLAGPKGNEEAAAVRPKASSRLGNPRLPKSDSRGGFPSHSQEGRARGCAAKSRDSQDTQVEILLYARSFPKEEAFTAKASSFQHTPNFEILHLN